MELSSREIFDLTAAWVALSIAFANLLGGINPEAVLLAGVTAGIGFLLHELAHKVVARNYGLYAEFRANFMMLFVAVLGSFAGFIFAAPGAVYTSGRRTSDQQLWISLAGPATNIVLALIFLFVPGIIGSYGFTINSWLALFNMLPIAGLDGQSIYRSNKSVFTAVILFAVFLVFVI